MVDSLNVLALMNHLDEIEHILVFSLVPLMVKRIGSCNACVHVDNT